MKNLIPFIITASLCGCGGGSDDSPSSTVLSSNTQAVSKTTYYNKSENAFPDLSIIYNKIGCGAKANTQFILPLDVNNDGRIDLAANLWCDLEDRGMSRGIEYNGPVPNTLVIFLQNIDGSFRLGNQELFGSEIVDITGTGEPGIGDFNGDGKKDIVYGILHEDGRDYENYGLTDSWSAQPVVILSQPDGSYKIEQVGKIAINPSVTIVKGKTKDDFITNDSRYSFVGNSWVSDDSYSWVDKTTLFFNDYVVQSFQPHLIKEFGYKLSKTKDGKNYELVDSVVLAEMSPVDIHNATEVKGGIQKDRLVTIDNVDYVQPSFHSFCTLFESENEKLIIAQFEGIKLSERYSGQKLSWNINVLQNNRVGKLYAFRVIGDTITRENLIGLSDLNMTRVFLTTCTDVNYDNQKDIVVYRWAWGEEKQKPYILLNKGSYGFTLVSEDKIPQPSENFYGNSVFMADLDNDNKAELIYYPLLGFKDSYQGKKQFELYKSVSPLN